MPPPPPRALAYLPAGTALRARMYPEIKPIPNSFVFELETNPAIFVYLDPTRPAAQVENTLAHELHHVGVSAACREPPDSALPAGLRRARTWASGFDEGRAVLAAAGGPDSDPHATSTPDEHRTWDRNLAQAPRDFGRLERFFDDVLDGRLQGDQLRQTGFSFVSAEGVPQGPFYTVGWLMSAVVEKELGRSRLVETLCDPPRFLADYDRAAQRANRRGAGPWCPARPCRCRSGRIRCCSASGETAEGRGAPAPCTAPSSRPAGVYSGDAGLYFGASAPRYLSPERP